MKLFNKSFGEYWQFAKTGAYLLAAMAVIRFILKPMTGLSYGQVTHFASVTNLMILLMLFYTIRARSSGFNTYRDLLGVAAVLGLSWGALTIIGIAVDEFGGIDTYYTDLAHGGDQSPWRHMGGHAIVSVVFSLILWGIGSLVNFVMHLRRKKAVA